jgi:hypothetical protein
MILDIFRKRSQNKLICEDYILKGKDYIILSDGCSSSKHTDFGSRILVHFAEKFLKELELVDDIKGYHHIGNKTIVGAQIVSSLYGDSNTWLDSTLTLMFHKNGLVHIYMYGDGFIILKDKNGVISYFEVIFNNNAPYYLNYLLNPERTENYVKEYDPDLTIICSNNDYGEGRFENSQYSIPPIDTCLPYSFPVYFKFPIDDYESILISSDGICPDTFKGIDFQKFLNDITTYANPVGVVLQRSCKRLFERLAKKGIVNYDDVSIGVIFNPD